MVYDRIESQQERKVMSRTIPDAFRQAGFSLDEAGFSLTPEAAAKFGINPHAVFYLAEELWGSSEDGVKRKFPLDEPIVDHLTVEPRR